MYACLLCGCIVYAGIVLFIYMLYIYFIVGDFEKDSLLSMALWLSDFASFSHELTVLSVTTQNTKINTPPWVDIFHRQRATYAIYILKYQSLIIFILYIVLLAMDRMTNACQCTLANTAVPLNSTELFSPF